MKKPWLASPPVSFSEAFPTVKKLRLVVTQYDVMESTTDEYLHFSLPPQIRCSNPICQQGGYELQTYLFALVDSKITKREWTEQCNGHEGSPKGRRKGETCCNYSKFTLSIEYKDESGS
jgi:hypothetical protein